MELAIGLLFKTQNSLMKGATWNLKETNRNVHRKAAYKRQLTASIKVIMEILWFHYSLVTHLFIGINVVNILLRSILYLPSENEVVYFHPYRSCSL